MCFLFQGEIHFTHTKKQGPTVAGWMGKCQWIGAGKTTHMKTNSEQKDPFRF